MENGEWRMENGEWRMENEEWGMENGKWGMENGEWRMENNLHFITYFTHRRQSPDSQQPIKNPSFKFYPFLLVNVSSLIDIAIYLWLGSIGDTTEFQLAF